ncbi:hypothetical protein AC1031_005542 [Aphanomyces cochlioides]|nr:hypothetical protein AC1031_005542 [Aphanomyces cochlioides]
MVAVVNVATLMPVASHNDGNVYWHHGQEGFTPSHKGPCEVWCDNTRVYQDDNCARNNPNGTMPIDLATCKKSTLMTVYWLALHSPSWQIYINCARIAGGAAPSPPSPSKTSTPSSAPHLRAIHLTHRKARTHRLHLKIRTLLIPYTPTPSDDPYTPYPSDSPYTPPHATPSPSSNGQAQGYSQCGGQNFNGPTQCVSGFRCNKWSEWYSQCVPSESQDGGVPTWGQCGGNDYNGSTNCKSSDVCTRRNDWYSQCVPK